MNKLLALLPVAVLVSTAAARASVLEDVTAESRKPIRRELSTVSFAMRFAAAIPSGKIASATNANELFGPSMTIDMMIDLRLGSRIILAPYVGLLRGSPGPALDVCEKDCELGGPHVGGMVRYTYARTKDFDAWAGYGFSRQWLAFSANGVVARFEGNHHHLALGADIFMNRRNDTRIGLYVDVAMGRYDVASLTTYQGEIVPDEPGFHQWTTVGAQFVF